MSLAIMLAVEAAQEKAKASSETQVAAAKRAAVVAKKPALEAVMDTFNDEEVADMAKAFGFKAKDFKVAAEKPSVELKTHIPGVKKGKTDKFLYVKTAGVDLADGTSAGGVYIRAESVKETIANLQAGLALLEDVGFEG